MPKVNGVSSSLNFWHSEVLYTYSAWGFGVARFNDKGNSQGPHNVERATESGFTSFLFLGYKESIAHKIYPSVK